MNIKNKRNLYIYKLKSKIELIIIQLKKYIKTNTFHSCIKKLIHGIRIHDKHLS